MPSSPRRRKPRTAPAIDNEPEAPPQISVTSETRVLAALKPYPNNPRTHSDTQIEQVCLSMLEFGAWTAPAVIDEQDVVLAGHGRRLAALRLVERGHAQFAENVPVRVVHGWSKAQKRAYVMADNSIADNAGWDTNLLRLEIGELQAIDFGTEVLGFPQEFLQELFADRNDGANDPDETPEPPAVALSQPGDIWLLGKHRLLCGDSTKAEDVARVLGKSRPHLMVTDPPYGVEYDANWRNEPEKLNLKSKPALGGVGAKNRNASTGKVLNDDRSDWTVAWRLFGGVVAYVWHGERQGPDLVGHFRSCGFEPRNLLVWAKDGLVISRGHYHPQHEGCWYFVRKGATARWSGDRKQSTLWLIPKNRQNESGHSTQKPVECMRRPIVNNSRPSDAVYEPFCGSGTTIIACEMEGRHCRAIELSPAYVDCAVLRWEKFAGKVAVLESTGRTFEETRAARVKPARAARSRTKGAPATPTPDGLRL